MRQYQKASYQSPKQEEKECGTEKVFKDIMAENFPNLAKDTNLQAQDFQRTAVG